MMEAAIKKIEEEIDQYSRVLVDGSIEDIAEYKRITGHIAGLSRAKQVLEDILNHVERDLD